MDSTIERLLSDAHEASQHGDDKRAEELIGLAESVAGIMETKLYDDRIKEMRESIDPRNKYDYARGT